MTGVELALFWVAWLVAVGSPGPATLSIAGTSMNAGRRLGVIFACGILAGGAFWGIAAALGMSALMLANAWVFTVLRYAGAGYLFYLAMKSLRSAMTAKPSLMRAGYDGPAARVFTRGALIHLTNPKAILSWGAVYSITLPSGASVSQVFQMFAFLYAGSILTFIGYAFLFSTDRMVRSYARMRRGFEAVFAVFFGLASLKILTTRLAP